MNSYRPTEASWGASLIGRKILTAPGDLVTEVTVNREVKNCGGPMRGGYNTFVEAVDGFILTKLTKQNILAKLQCTVKNRMNVKTSSYHMEFSH